MIFPTSILSYLPIPATKKSLHTVNTMRKMIKKIMMDRKIKIENGEDDSSDLLSLLMTAEHDGEKIPEELIIDESFTFLFAGHDVSKTFHLLNSSDNFLFGFQYNFLLM